MADKKTVTFRARWQRYNAGETAGFAPEKADALVKAGIAVAGISVPKSKLVVPEAEVAFVDERRQAGGVKDGTAAVAGAARETPDAPALPPQGHEVLAIQDPATPTETETAGKPDPKGDAPKKTAGK